jgi:hypothetical protein
MQALNISTEYFFELKYLNLFPTQCRILHYFIIFGS